MVRTAIIGVGRMGRRHVQAVRALGLDLVGIADLRQESLSLVESECAIPTDLQFVDAGLLLKETRPEFVIIATTAPGHCPLTCMAAEAGARYILCEKPMGTSLAECDLMLDICRAYGARFAINHPRRFLPQGIEPKRVIESEVFGGLRSMTVVGGNFGMAMVGTHYFELFRYLSGEDPEEITAWFSPERLPNPRGAEFEDRAGAVRMLTGSGRRFYMEIGADQGHGIKTIYAGSRGQLTVDELAGVLYLSVREEQYRDLPTTRYAMPSVDTMYRSAPLDVVEGAKVMMDAFLHGKNAPTGEDGRAAIAVLVAAHVSDENGHVPIRIDDGGLPRDRVFPWA